MQKKTYLENRIPKKSKIQKPIKTSKGREKDSERVDIQKSTKQEKEKERDQNCRKVNAPI